MRFLPREEKFYDYFIQQAKFILEASTILLDGCEKGELQSMAERISVIENEADKIIHVIERRLHQTFITPLDPEDIHYLATQMDSVVDSIEDAAHHMHAYRLGAVPAPMIELCKVVHQCAQKVEHAVGCLSHNGDLTGDCIDINTLEEKADQIMRKAIANLFDNEKDPINLLKQKEIYELLEAATDTCEDVADTLQNIVVKNS